MKTLFHRRAFLAGGLAVAATGSVRADPTVDAALRSRVMELFGPATPMAAPGADGGEDPSYLFDKQFRQFAEEHWRADGERWETANYYDRARVYYLAWARSGEPEYLRRANRLAVNYRDAYLIANKYQPSAHWAQMAGVLLHHVTTGDETSRETVIRVSQTFTAPYYIDNLGDISSEMDNRVQARVLTSLLYAWQAGRKVDKVIAQRMRVALNAILRSQAADGAFRFTRAQCGGVKPFMTGLLIDALIEYHDQFERDPRIVDAIRRAVDYLWTATWDAASGSFWYVSEDCKDEKREPAPDLNLMIVNGFGFTFAKSGEEIWRQRGDLIFAEGVRRAWLKSSKTFNQNYTTGYRYLGYRTGRS